MRVKRENKSVDGKYTATLREEYNSGPITRGNHTLAPHDAAQIIHRMPRIPGLPAHRHEKPCVSLRCNRPFAIGVRSPLDRHIAAARCCLLTWETRDLSDVETACVPLEASNITRAHINLSIVDNTRLIGTWDTAGAKPSRDATCV